MPAIADARLPAATRNSLRKVLDMPDQEAPFLIDFVLQHERNDKYDKRGKE